MKTKVSILGADTAPEKKPIEFKLIATVSGDQDIAFSKPSRWANITLISKYHHDGMDLMFAWNEDTSRGVLYLGHFNDGVVDNG